MPTLSDLRLTTLVMVGFATFAAVFGLSTGLFDFELAEPTAILRIAAIALFLPALFEELVFRYPLLWLKQRDSRHTLVASGAMLVAFILWHPLNASFLMVEARELFFDWRFLTIAAGLGVATTLLTLRAGKLWPAIALHWGAVVGWKAFLGGPTLL